MKCPNCGSNNSIKDSGRGDTVCGDCGKVLEESEVVCDVAFENTKVVGSFVTDQIGGFSFTKNRHGNLMLESSEIRRSKAYSEIQKLASNLLINHYMVEIAKKYYNLASAKRFIQGRKTKHVIGVILYTVCRLQKTRHLLLDFSEALQTNLYVLGSVYLKLIRVLQITVPIVDPSLFIKRFCTKLEYGDKTNLVSSTALKIMQCMDRDWMTTGRRPAGLCGASILIASRYHGFRRSIKEITHVVRVCDETIRRRLEEFSKTSTARLTVNQFESNEDILDDGKGRDPPAFIKNRLKEKELNNQELVTKAKEIERMFKYEVSNKETLTCSNENNVNENSIIIESFQKSEAPVKTSSIDGEMKTHLLSDDSINFPIPFKSEEDKIIPSQKSLNKENKIINSKEEEELSDIEIEESSLYIVSNQEYKLKKLLWEVLFKDWIEEQKDKKKAEKKEVKKRERKFSKPDTKGLNDPVDAIVNSNKFKKMNVNFLNTMFNKN